jgi:hypothetical protein
LRYYRSRFFTLVFFMQKLKGVSSGQNNNSSRIFHHESNKIGFTVFRFFCDFYAIYKKLGNSLYYFSCTFAAGTLERIFLSQCDPWARLAGAGEPNPASSPPGLAGDGLGRGLGTLGARFGALDRAVVAQASGSPAAREGRPPRLPFPASWALLVLVDGPVSCG